jgi:linoleate 8R-lipoxygenase / 9,12-octadecadienoate 8-hydroperoxide 8R-isomerase
MYPANRPDPGTLFDGASFLNLLIVALVARTEYKPHPNKISSLWFYMTVIITHGISSSFLLTYLDLFRTSHDDVEINMTSSYFDLSPLYGSSEEEQNTVRTFKDGKLRPDTFYESRLDVFPSGVAVLLVCFNRFHNYVVEQLAIINEGGRFSLPSRRAIEKSIRTPSHGFTEDQIKADVDMSYNKALTKFDNDLFQTGRLYISSSISS